MHEQYGGPDKKNLRIFLATCLVTDRDKAQTDLDKAIRFMQIKADMAAVVMTLDNKSAFCKAVADRLGIEKAKI